MSATVFSPLWYRVAGLKPRLRANVRVQRQRYRDDDWYLLVDEATDRVFRLNAGAYAFIGRCDGRQTAQRLWDFLSGESADALPGQDALLRLLARLQEAGLITFDRRPDIGSVFERHQKAERRQRHGGLNPLSFRVRLGDPTRVLTALRPIGNIAFHPAMLFVWLIGVGLAALAAVLNFDALAAHASRVLAGGDGLWMLWWVYPPVKLIHELAHGLAVRRWGGEVNEWGMTLLVLMPMPWVDASASGTFRHARQRMAVSAAGIFAELALAAIALVVWLMVEPGLVRDTALTVMFVASVSTLLINGNPLLRFDGYYILGDALDLPNLAARSRRWWINTLRARVLGAPPADDMILARGERRWLIFYQPASWFYRLGLSAGIALWLGDRVPLFGYVAAIWFAWQLLVAPLVALMRSLLDAHMPEAHRSRARVLAIVVALLVPLMLFGVPVPHVTLAEGVVSLPDDAQLRAVSAGFVAQFEHNDGDAVRAGDVIVRLYDDRLMAREEQLKRQHEGLESELFTSLRTDPVRAGRVGEQIAQVEKELARVREQIAGLTVRAARAGQLVIPNQADLAGRFLPRGEQLGVVLDTQPAQVRVAVPHADAEALEQVENIEVQLVDRPDTQFHAELIGQEPAASRQLPSQALGTAGGGRLLVDPADAEGLTLIDPVVRVDLRLPDLTHRFSGERVVVRFNHGKQSIAAQCWRALRQLLLTRFTSTEASWLR